MPSTPELPPSTPCGYWWFAVRRHAVRVDAPYKSSRHPNRLVRDYPCRHHRYKFLLRQSSCCCWSRLPVLLAVAVGKGISCSKASLRLAWVKLPGRILRATSI